MTAEPTHVQPPRRADVFIVGLLFAVLFGYSLYMAIGNFQGLPLQYEFFGIPEQTPWALLVIGIALPPVLYAAAMALGRRRPLVARAGILLVAFAVNAQLTLLLQSLVQ